MNEIAKTLLRITAVVGAIAVLLTPASAAAAKSCGEKVIDDWYGDGVVNDVYPLRCYRDALKRLPDDVEQYSNAPDVIQRALQDAIREQQQPSSSSATSPAEDPETRADSETREDAVPADPGANDDTDASSSGAPGSDGGPDGGTPSPAAPEGSDDDRGGIAGAVLEDIGPNSADGLPLPVLIVGALALLLLAAGSAGLIARKLQARKIRPGPPAQPPGSGL